MSTDAAVEPTTSAPPSPSTDGVVGPDEKGRWDEHASDSDSAEVVNYNKGVDAAVDLVYNRNVLIGLIHLIPRPWYSLAK
jgi:hypothetical protein